MITELEQNQIFIFGSNKMGHHSGGAAKLAYEKFGAVWGFGEGLFGQSYAFPTLDREMKQVTKRDLEIARDNLYDTLGKSPDKQFLLTKVGCGIAGFEEWEIRQLFENPPKNLILPEDWKNHG